MSRSADLRDPWFALRPLGDEVYLVGEPPHVNSYLVVGSERAALVDTGMGIGDIEAAVRRITDRDVLVVSTHHHWDHRGGHASFAEVAAHPVGVPLLLEPVPAGELTAYVEFLPALHERFEAYREIDDAYFRLLRSEYVPRQLPPGFTADAWRIPPVAATTTLVEGDTVDLGNRSLHVLHTPGHAPDAICLLEERTGRLFAGDTLATGPHTAALPLSDPDAFVASLSRLAAEVAASVSVVHPGHMLRAEAPGALIREVAAAFAAIADGGRGEAFAVDGEGDDVLQFWFDGFSIMVPADWPGARGEPAT